MSIRAWKFIIISVILALFLIPLIYLSRGRIYEKSELEYGITFSKKQAASLGFDWREAYLIILDGLKIKKLRLPVYWDEVENMFGEYDWRDLDWQMEEAADRNIEIILAAGGRLPRWPECHFPDWINRLNKDLREQEILKYLEEVVKRYRSYEQIKAWQVENEPFLTHFGDCPKLDKAFLDKEIALVRALDKRPIVVTDSGELSFWVAAAKRADIFGTTMYKHTYSSNLKSYIHYPITPAFFRIKRKLTNYFAKPADWIVAELQAEPWGPKPYQELTAEERSRTMDLKKFKDIIEFSSQTGFKEFYLWGAEWWYWEKEQGRPEVWEEARTLFNK